MYYGPPVNIPGYKSMFLYDIKDCHIRLVGDNTHYLYPDTIHISFSLAELKEIRNLNIGDIWTRPKASVFSLKPDISIQRTNKNYLLNHCYRDLDKLSMKVEISFEDFEWIFYKFLDL